MLKSLKMLTAMFALVAITFASTAVYAADSKKPIRIPPIT